MAKSSPDLEDIDTSSGRGRRECLLVAAIDFGTTFSSYAFSFTSSKNDITMNKNWGSESGMQSHKTETSVLLDSNKGFKAFGFEASKTFANLEESDAKKHFFFHRFKMELYTKKKLTKDTTIKDVNGKKMPALDIFAHAMRYLRDHMLDAITRTISSELGNDDICWVLTVPAIWDNSAKQFMREAAYRAGVANETNKDQLLIALEPEAAGICCCHDSTSNELIDIQQGDRYMIVDCGGGTVDIAVHEISENGHVKEVAVASGGNWGGTKVDEEFFKLLDSIFSANIMAKYKVKHPLQYLDILNAFEIRKRSTGPNSAEDSWVAVTLPHTFFQFYPKHARGLGQTVEKAIRKYSSPQVTFSNGYIRLNHSLMQSFFAPVIESILGHLDNLLKREVAKPLKCIFMVGGFSESPILQHAIKERFQGQCDVIVPDMCGLSIIKGAVMFGHDPSSIVARKSKYTYGISVMYPFIPEKHPTRLRKRIDGKLMCTNVFLKFVEAGQSVEVGEVSEHVLHPVHRRQSSMELNIFRTNEKEVNYCDEEGVTKCGYLTVGLPEGNGINRDVKATITFAETEINVDAFAVGSGERASTKVNFLQA